MYKSLEHFEKLAKDNNIDVIYLNCSNKPLKAFIIKYENKYYIMIDSNASMKEKKEMLAHGLAHFFTKTLYSVNDTEEKKIEKENIANAYMRKELLNDEK